MDTFDLDLEDLDLKSVDVKPTTPITTSNDFRNISFNGGSSQSNINFNTSRPNLTISSSNNDPMPSGFSSDKEVDFGLDLLMNKKKMRPETEVNKLGGGGGGSGAPSPTPKSMSFGYGGTSSGGFPERVDLSNETDILQKSLFDNMTDIDLDKELNTLDLGDIAKPKPAMSGPSLPSFTSSSANTTTPSAFHNNMAASATSSYPSASMGSGYGSINTGGISSNAGLSFEEIQTKKFDLLCKFERLRDKGIKLPKTFSMSSSLDEMELEYKRLVEHRQLDNSVKMQRRMLISFASMAEFLNGKFSNPFDLHIDGWSEQLSEEAQNSEFDQCFEDLFYKYKDTINMAPELKLAMMVGSSAFWYHLTSNMSKSMMPNLMNNVMKQNPDLMKQFQNATLNTMSQGNPAMAQFMNNMTPGMNQGPPKYNPTGMPPFTNPRDAPPRGQTTINQTDDIDALIDSISS
jgi:hypothetical protein